MNVAPSRGRVKHRSTRLTGMPGFTLVNLEDVDDSAVEYGLSPASAFVQLGVYCG